MARVQSIACKSSTPNGAIKTAGIHLVVQGTNKINGRWRAVRKAIVIQNQVCRLNFHLIAMARATIAADTKDGSARSNLPQITEGIARRAVPNMTHSTPRHPRRIRLSSLVITCDHSERLRIEGPYTRWKDCNRILQNCWGRVVASTLTMDQQQSLTVC